MLDYSIRGPFASSGWSSSMISEQVSFSSLPLFLALFVPPEPVRSPSRQEPQCSSTSPRADIPTHVACGGNRL
jgi:hypothetical protein